MSNSDIIRFGTGGWRGIIGDDFIKSNIQRVAYAICLLAKREGRADKPIAIGYDRRFLSQSAMHWVAEVITAAGIPVIMTARSTPSPLIMFIVKDKGLHYGIEITASHNPPEYNGIKLIVDEGRDAPLETTELLEQIIEQTKQTDIPTMKESEADAKGLITHLRAPFNDFIDSILMRLDQAAIKERSLRILFDPMHGSGTYPLMVILQTLRCTVDLINDNKDAYFGGGMPAPSPRGLAELSNQVVAGGYDMGIAFDGDGDRLGIVDENGRYIDANKILCMLYYYLRKYKNWRGPVVRNLATTHLLDRIAHSFGEECYEVPIGFKYISSAIDRYDAVLGGESSGGLTVRGHIHGKDSVYSASLFVEMICAVGVTPSRFIEQIEQEYGSYELVEENLAFERERKEEMIRRLMVDRELPRFDPKIVRVNYEDGCKVYFSDDSFVICRFSGTEPLLRIFAEAQSGEIARKYISAFREMLEI